MEIFTVLIISFIYHIDENCLKTVRNSSSSTIMKMENYVKAALPTCDRTHVVLAFVKSRNPT